MGCDTHCTRGAAIALLWSGDLNKADRIALTVKVHQVTSSTMSFFMAKIKSWFSTFCCKVYFIDPFLQGHHQCKTAGYLIFETG